MGAVPAQVLACGTWSPPDVLGVRGYSGKRPWWVRQPMNALSKTDLRKAARARRKQFVAERGSAAFPTHGPAVDRLFALVSDGLCVAGYLPMHSEADVRPLLTVLEGKGIRLALPWLGASDAGMVFRGWTEDAPLLMSNANFLQPLDSAVAMVPDIILMPMLGFDRQGNRLGQGAGHYDRALVSRQEALRIGIGWSVQEFDDLPADPWDMPLDAILTEAEWVIPETSRLKKD